MCCARETQKTILLVLCTFILIFGVLTILTSPGNELDYALGGVATLVALLGCCGAYMANPNERENCSLKTFKVVMGILLLLTIVNIILFSQGVGTYDLEMMIASEFCSGNQCFYAINGLQAFFYLVAGVLAHKIGNPDR